MKLLHSFLILSLFLFKVAGLKGEEVQKFNFAVFAVPNYLENEKEGVFIDIVDEVARRSHLKFEKKVYPPTRAFMHTGEVEGFFPLVLERQREGVLKSSPYYYKKDYLFVLDEKVNLKAQMSICLTRGYFYGKKVLSNKKFEFVYAHSDEACLKMLADSRVDGFVCELATGVLTLEKLKLKEVKIVSKELDSTAVGVGFLDNERGAKALKIFDQNLNEMKKDKKYLDYFKSAIELARKYGVEFNPIEP